MRSLFACEPQPIRGISTPKEFQNSGFELRNLLGPRGASCITETVLHLLPGTDMGEWDA
jgi:hypothetical protein